MEKYLGRHGESVAGPLGPFHAASQNSFYLKDVQETLKLTFGLTVLGLLELLYTLENTVGRKLSFVAVLQ